MKLFSAQQIKQWDEYTVEHQLISSLALMERAAISCVDWLIQRFRKNETFVLFCGNGNNGGDGFAIARLLYEKGYNVDVFCDQQLPFSKDAAANFKKCKSISAIALHAFSAVTRFCFDKNTVLVDALLGTGLNRNVEGELAKLITFINNEDLIKVSIDLPSGLRADEMTCENAVIFQADDTLTFQSWKKSLLHPETGCYAGNVHLLDIKLDQNFLLSENTNEFSIDEQLIKGIYKPRKEFSHKGTYGKTTIIAGSFGKIGAAIFATKAAMKSGSGLTFILAPKCGYEILQSNCPEAMFVPGGQNDITAFPIERDSVVGIGSGMGTHDKTEIAFLKFLKNGIKPLVLDADALNILAKNPSYLSFIPENSIITPHPKEFERLFGKTKNSFERLILAREKALALKIFIVLKDHHTQIITPGKQIFYNSTGNSGMAKGGSGDALLGIITSLLAQNYSSEDAAIFGVWLHGKAGDFAAAKYSKEAMLPTDLIDQLGNVFKFLA
ncbi:NAD(P)H-hydrate dehydratase [Chryseobacterium sp. SNU WT5]|uniref:NAD(P)H-hydrate dehydratase n=1 Tax=Chryseobacterium sp. SNU WT5 TaxID=2594269 RepID=UPI00117FDBC0|nr:NAD(P)H-hydrate dehydratase [Chryseobacterium sp. SNU WT5]QDP86143.1 NAD(P)H-hydrate dehydratase [Chryseobacterium sp. SNU WT5]